MRNWGMVQPPFLFNLRPHQLTICGYFCISICICFLGLTYLYFYLHLLCLYLYFFSVVGRTSQQQSKAWEVGRPDWSLINWLFAEIPTHPPTYFPLHISHFMPHIFHISVHFQFHFIAWLSLNWILERSWVALYSVVCQCVSVSGIGVTRPNLHFFQYIQAQGCISCGILVSGIGARGVSSEHMENMEMFSCSPT